MTEEEIKAMQDEMKSLKRQVLVETMKRLGAEMQAAKASIAAIELRIPMIHSEMESARDQLGKLSD